MRLLLEQDVQLDRELAIVLQRLNSIQEQELLILLQMIETWRPKGIKGQK